MFMAGWVVHRHTPPTTPPHTPQAMSHPRILSRSFALPVVAALFGSIPTIPGLASDRPDMPVANFEGATYGDWKVDGDAFGTGPARGGYPGQMVVEGFRGKGLVSSFAHGDSSTGTLTSPPFTVERNYVEFLIGGGGFAGKTCINLVVDGQVVRTATGPNTDPGGSERLEPRQWAVTDLAGKSAVLKIVDSATGGWGHINIDEITQTDRRLPGVLTNATRQLTLQGRYLHLPVRNGGAKRQVSVLVGGNAERQFEIELADREPDWWAFLDTTSLSAKEVAITVDRLPEDSQALTSITSSDTIQDSGNLYHEALRPQFHFSSRRGWNNDPNGLVFHAGEYHLFYQHNPYGWGWGNMHWGHAVSPDLVHWRELPIALYPDRHGTMFSGSAVVDWNNSAGFQTGTEKPIVCIFTAAGNPFTQGLAFSNDRGRTWTKFDGNPVIPHIIGGNRDPKVFWHEPGHRWIMALYLDKSDYALFASSDLKHWDKLSTVVIPGTSECPEFFEISVAGKPAEKRWIFYGGNGRYLVGTFDGTTFTPNSGPHSLHNGNAWYASQTYTDIPASDGRRILIPWAQINTPGMPFNQMMGTPVELTLLDTDAGPRLSANPVRELATLRARTHALPAQQVKPGDNPLAGIHGELLDLTAEMEPGDSTEISFQIRGTDIVWNAAKNEVTCAKNTAPLRPVHGQLRFRMLVDRTSLDIFGNDGHAYLPMGVLHPADNRSLSLSVKGGTATLRSLSVHELKSAWEP